tara:strand:- start:84 stop:407 length:324 start_codon:yes stop_codon:yes gene_type:complete
MTNYVATLMYLVPNAKLSYTGNDLAYADITWLDDRKQPTKAKCDSVWQQVEYEANFAIIESQRLSRYQSETDGVFFAAMRTGSELTNWITAVEAIKAELPYPEQPAA